MAHLFETWRNATPRAGLLTLLLYRSEEESRQSVTLGWGVRTTNADHHPEKVTSSGAPGKLAASISEHQQDQL